jgi:hypothetical protein
MVPDNAFQSGDADIDAELAGRLAAGIVPGRLLGNGKRSRGYHHDRASEDAVRGDPTTSSSSSAVGHTLEANNKVCFYYHISFVHNILYVML